MRFSQKRLNLNSDNCDILKPNRILTAFLENKKIDFIDLTPHFENEINTGKQLYYLLDGHWNKEGASSAAKIIFEYLIQRNLFN